MFHSSRRDRGASAIEYALLVAAIAAVIIGIAFGLSVIVRDAFAPPTPCPSGSVVGGSSCPGTP